jgi:hypothetical protein
VYVVHARGGAEAPYTVAKLSRKALRQGGAGYALRKLAEAAASAASEGASAWPHAQLDLAAARAALRAQGGAQGAPEERDEL